MEHAPTRESLGARLKTARGDISRTWAAAQIRVSDDTLARYEAGQGEPSYRQVAHLAHVYEKPLDWFVGEEVAAA